MDLGIPIPPAEGEPLLPGRRLGVLGGGQLGRMFVHAAQSMGYRAVVLDPDEASPAGAVAELQIESPYDDPDGLDSLTSDADAVTTEFENVPAACLDMLEEYVRVAPNGAALAICQDRAREKAHFAACGVPSAPHAVIETAADLAAIDPALLPGILKTAGLGYDGKGQARVGTPAALAEAWSALGNVRCVLEHLLPLAYEVSVVIARGRDGAIVHLPLQENVHRDGILATTTVPAASATPELAAQAIEAAERIAAELGYLGVLCVEFFVLEDGSLVANEMAPRPHNSGHYSIDACDCSQFELQVRTLAGLPLATPRLHSPAVMLNLLGDLWFAAGAAGEPVDPDWASVLALPGAHLHLYGKAEPRPGRKMGHLTITASTPEQAQAVAAQASAVLGLPA